MLSAKTYPTDYVDACQARIERQLNTLGSETAELRDEFLTNLVLALELHFVHRMRGNEGKNGNPLNEVRMLAASICTSDGILTADKTIKYNPDTSITGLAIGAPITLDPDQVRKLADAFFTELRNRYGE